jgi:hypothetical protein
MSDLLVLTITHTLAFVFGIALGMWLRELGCSWWSQ